MNALEGRWRSSIRDLQEKEAYLEQRVSTLSVNFAGLTDIDATLELVCTRLTIAIRLIELIASTSDSESNGQMGELAKREAIAAVQMLEEIATAPVSLDQKELVLEAPGYEEALQLFQQLILSGGGAFFETQLEDKRHAAVVAETIADSIARYARPDHDYGQLFRTERLPGLLRSLLNVFFPVLAAEDRKQPPFGIEEGEQEIYSSEHIKLPLSQAIHYYENEVLPELEQELRDAPGDPLLQREIDRIERLIREYRQMRFVPRSTPVLLTQDFYTQSITEYTVDGELLVPVDLPVSFGSGTNLERMQELVQADVVRRLAGKGICPELDEEYARMKSLASGLHGSSRTPSLKLNTSSGFGMLKRSIPVMRYLENKSDFKRLVAMMSEGKRKSVVSLLGRSILSSEGRPRAIE